MYTHSHFIPSPVSMSVARQPVRHPSQPVATRRNPSQPVATRHTRHSPSRLVATRRDPSQLVMNSSQRQTVIHRWAEEGQESLMYGNMVRRAPG